MNDNLVRMNQLLAQVGEKKHPTVSTGDFLLAYMCVLLEDIKAGIQEQLIIEQHKRLGF